MVEFVKGSDYNEKIHVSGTKESTNGMVTSMVEFVKGSDYNEKIHVSGKASSLDLHGTKLRMKHEDLFKCKFDGHLQRESLCPARFITVGSSTRTLEDGSTKEFNEGVECSSICGYDV